VLEDVAEQCAGECDTDPEDDQDERRREVVQRRVAAREAGYEHDDQRDRPKGAADRLDGAAADHAAARECAPAGVLEAGAGPQRAQRNERHDQHRGRGPAEQPLRDRQVRALHEPVRGRRCGQERDGGERGGREPRHSAQGGGGGTAQRLMAKKTLTPRVQRNFIAVPAP
jgi:hypothetical protein